MLMQWWKKGQSLHTLVMRGGSDKVDLHDIMDLFYDKNQHFPYLKFA